MKIGKYQRQVLEGIKTSPLVNGCYRGQSYWGTWSRTWETVYRLKDLGLLEEVHVTDEQSRFVTSSGYQLTEKGHEVLAA